jgi:hypothetical protein
MKHLLAVLALCLFALPVFAAEPPSSITTSLAWQDGKDTGRTWAANLALDFPVFKHFSIGPVLEARFFSSEVNPDPEDTGSLTLFNIGGQGLFYFGDDHNGIGLGAEVLYVSNDATGYLVVPFGQFEYGTDSAFFRARYRHPFHYANDGGDTIDLERNEVTAGIGWRF